MVIDNMEPTSATSGNVSFSFRVETSARQMEGRLATIFALANGTIGIRGTLEEMPSWASPGFYVAGTYSPGPREKLVQLHPDCHILVDPESLRAERLAEHQELTTLPNLPYPLAMRLYRDRRRLSFDDVEILSCERNLRMDKAALFRRLVFRERSGAVVVIDSERYVSWADKRLIGWRYALASESCATDFFAEPFFIRMFQMAMAYGCSKSKEKSIAKD